MKKHLEKSFQAVFSFLIKALLNSRDDDYRDCADKFSITVVNFEDTESFKIKAFFIPYPLLRDFLIQHRLAFR